MSLGKRIRLVRKRRDLTLRQLGDAVGVSEQAVSQWERDIDRPDIDNIPAIVKTLKTTADYILMNIGSPDGPGPFELRMSELPAHDRALILGMLELVPKASDKTG